MSISSLTPEQLPESFIPHGQDTLSLLWELVAHLFIVSAADSETEQIWIEHAMGSLKQPVAEVGWTISGQPDLDTLIIKLKLLRDERMAARQVELGVENQEQPVQPPPKTGTPAAV